jgi:hypothetical protein
MRDPYIGHVYLCHTDEGTASYPMQMYFNPTVHDFVFDAHFMSEYNLKLTYLITAPFALKLLFTFKPKL